jgi:hypothetical protein
MANEKVGYQFDLLIIILHLDQSEIWQDNCSY